MIIISYSNKAFLNDTDDPTNTKLLVISTEEKMISVLVEYNKKIAGVFDNAMGDTTKPEKLIGFSQQAILDIQELDDELDELEKDLGSDLMGILSQSITQAYRNGVNQAQRQINRIQTHPTIPRLSKQDQQTIQLIQNSNFSLIKTLSAQEIARAKDMFISGLANGLSQQEIIDSIIVVTSGSEYQIRRIVRTELTRTSNVGAKKRYLNSGIKYVQWNTATDERVCVICGELHGKVIKMGENFTTYLTGTGQKRNKGKIITMPPAHPNCRCGLSPAFRKIRSPVTKKPKPVKVAAKFKGFSTKERADIKADMKVIPSQIRATIDSLNGLQPIYKSKQSVLVEDEEVKKVVPQTVIDNYRDATGLFVGSGVNRIFVAKGTGKEELYHEIGHSVYNQYIDNNTRIKNQFTDLWNTQIEDNKLPTIRSWYNPDEFFSDVFSYYYINNLWLKDEYPLIHEFLFKNVFFGNTKEKIISMEISI